MKRENRKMKKKLNAKRLSEMKSEPVVLQNALGLNLFGLPVLVVNLQGLNMLFILDSGSDESYIDERVYEEFKDKMERVDPIGGHAIGMEGKKMQKGFGVKMKFTVGKHSFKMIFNTLPGNFSNSFDTIQKESGYFPCGILGMDFIGTNRLVLDFITGKILMMKREVAA